jgi:hypothetical protein
MVASQGQVEDGVMSDSHYSISVPAADRHSCAFGRHETALASGKASATNVIQASIVSADRPLITPMTFM